MGRPPVFQTAMTPAERKRRERDKIKIGKQPAAPGGEFKLINGAVIQDCFQKATINSRLKPLSINKCELIAADISQYPSVFGPLTGRSRIDKTLKMASSILEKYVELEPRLEKQIRLLQYHGVPDEKNKVFDLLKINKEFQDILRIIIDIYGKNSGGPAWWDLALMIAFCGIIGWREEGRFPRSFNERDPACIFVTHVLKSLGIHKTTFAVSAVLRRRRRLFWVLLSERDFRHGRLAGNR